MAYALRHRLMAPEMVDLHEREVGQADAERAALDAKLRRLDSQINKLVEAIAAAGHSAALLAKLASLEADKAEITAEIAVLDATAGARPPPLNTDMVEAAYRWLVERIIEAIDPESVSPENAGIAASMRDAFRAAVERITVQPTEDGEAVILFEGSFNGTLAAAGVAQPIKNKSPPGWRPRGFNCRWLRGA